jgi:hypothetical protein
MDGKTVFCPACDTSSVLKIDTMTNHCSTFGFAGKAKNKWQGGVISKRDGCLYCIPASGTQILRIPTHPDTLQSDSDKEVVQLLGDLPVHKDKWQVRYVVDLYYIFLCMNSHYDLVCASSRTILTVSLTHFLLNKSNIKSSL